MFYVGCFGQFSILHFIGDILLLGPSGWVAIPNFVATNQPAIEHQYSVFYPRTDVSFLDVRFLLPSSEA